LPPTRNLECISALKYSHKQAIPIFASFSKNRLKKYPTFLKKRHLNKR
jgi:hypothetical protein